MKENNLGLILGAFIVILVGVVLIQSIADSVSELDDTIPLTTNQSFTWQGNNTEVAFDDDDVITSTVVAYCNVSTLTLNENYTVSDAGISIINLTAGTGGVGHTIQLCNFNMTYTHEGDNYVEDTTSRTMIGLVTLFFALAILIVGYVIVKKSYENMGF